MAKMPKQLLETKLRVLKELRLDQMLRKPDQIKAATIGNQESLKLKRKDLQGEDKSSKTRDLLSIRAKRKASRL